jgi:hypothetical protein
MPTSCTLQYCSFQFSPRVYDWIYYVKVKVTLRLTVSQSVSLGIEPHLGLMTRYLLPFDSYGIVFRGAPFLTRWRVCLLYTYMLLALASAVFLGSESLWTRDHILLSQIWDFPLCHLLRLVGSRSRWIYYAEFTSLTSLRHGKHRKQPLLL